ncbi:inverse autotransporter beta domain-containing protein, partial [Serratia sp. Z4]|uniref:inverse autotransporter beta domain-containing protein n=1 Tax=Serratia sp. Z4 TaxID=2738127 RepID=UPI0013580554
MQFALPISVAFTPIMAARAAQSPFMAAGPEVASLATLPYVLKDGESVDSVAARYNMTPEALRKLNQFRTFANGWGHLRAGDELDVPTAPLPKVVWEGDKKSSPHATPKSDNAADHRVASWASQAGGLLANKPNGDALAAQARGMATGAAGSEVQQWLSQFGTARVQLEADKNFSLKNSQLDLLVPLHEQQDRLTFAQGSLHRTDARTQANLGVGHRRFNDGWMMGGNAFLDHDLSRSHSRMGVGLEYWRDYLKLDANGYLRLTNWKDSPDLTDYQERPANGWDVRAQAWLPSLPQLGGKLTYEKYYGNEVGLFGRDSRQRNPGAVTAGVNYTPFPLLTLNTEHRQGQSGKSSARVGVEVRYQLGVPWRQQLDPGAVASLRSLAGSRYDLVDRNNNIVLEYRKKEVVSLRTVEAVSGHAGEKKSLGVVVNSKYGLSHIEWSAPTLLAAGGKILQEGAAEYAVVLPVYQSMAGSVNTYTVSGIAMDKQGNASNQSETQVTVQAPVISESQSSLSPAESTLPADGKSTQVLTLSLKDAQGQAVDIARSDVVIHAEYAKRSGGNASVSEPKLVQAGIYEVTVVAGTVPEVLVLTPVVSGVPLPPARVVINDMAPDAAKSSFTATPDTIVASDPSGTTLTLTLKNAAGDALSGVAEQLAFVVSGESRARSVAGVTLSAVTESAQKGEYVATLKGDAAGKYTVVPKYNGSAIGGLRVEVAVTAGGVVVGEDAQSSVQLDKASYVSGDTMHVTVTLKDAAGNAVTGQSALLTPDSVSVPGAASQSAVWSDNGDGTYGASYVAHAVGANLKTTVTLDGKSVSSAAYAVTAGGVVVGEDAQSSVQLDKASYVSGDTMHVTVTLKDAAGNAVTGQSALLTPDSVSVPGAASQSAVWSDNGDGTYGASYVAHAVGANLKTTVTLDGKSVSSAAYAV